jgi:NADPH-dependent glutamate synthase beta subunit-like oxidoreductase/ferredoxin
LIFAFAYQMPKLIIDNREVEVPSGATILDAAQTLGITIPAMCFLRDPALRESKGYEPSTSCMVCVVKIEGRDAFVPACGSIAQDGMRVCTSSQEVRQARKTALELLLSDHLGDCMGPCQVTCPAGMNIPLMIRQIAAGDLHDAIATVKKDIALPAVLGRICPAPCEKACRRAQFDGAVSICLLKRYVADVDLQSASPYLPPLRQSSVRLGTPNGGQACTPGKNKCVAIVGAGPAGLAAAYYLRQQGYDCTVFDQREKPGGALRYSVPQEKLPTNILDKEISLIEKLGVKFQGKTRIDQIFSLSQLRRDFDAVFVAVGQLHPGDAERLGLAPGPHGIVIDAGTYQTSLPGVFAGGDAVRTRRLTVRAVADGKEAAVSIGQYLSGQEVTGPPKAFNIHIGKLTDEEMKKFVAGASTAPRVTLSQGADGLTHEQAESESARCLHCDCRKAEGCKLRQYAQEYEARPSRYKNQKTEDGRQRTEDRGQKTENRPALSVLCPPSSVLRYEPGKCIKCGLCIKIAAQAGERPGLTFVGRGFDVRVAVPFDGQLSESLKTAARQCAAACPTGALSFKTPRETRG